MSTNVDNTKQKTQEQIHEVAEEILGNAAKKVNSLNMSPVPANVYTVDNETKLEKEDFSGSYLSVVTDFIPNGSLVGGFTTSQITKTFKTRDGRGYIDSEIHITLSESAIENDGLKVSGIEKALKVLTEGYLKSLEVLYHPDQLSL